MNSSNLTIEIEKSTKLTTPTPYCDASLSSFIDSVSLYLVPIRTIREENNFKVALNPETNGFRRAHAQITNVQCSKTE